MRGTSLLLSVTLIILLLPGMAAAGLFSSKDLVFSFDSQEYYFRIGEPAVINLTSQNSYGEKLSGTLTYTIIQSVSQGSMMYSSSDTRSVPFSVSEGTTVMPFDFGTSNSPATLSVDIKFSYNIGGDNREVAINDIKIFFVNNNSQASSQQNKVSSSSQKSQTQRSTNQNKLPSNQQSLQQSLQNSQLNQDSSALKKQIEKEISEQQKLNDEFKRQLAENNDFRKAHQAMLDQGFNLTGADVNPSSNNTGSFELSYQDDKGNLASLKGVMENGSITSLQEDTPKSRDELFDKLKQDDRFRRYDDKLQKEGFTQGQPSFSYANNKTVIDVPYAKNNNTATITAEIVDDTITDVRLSGYDDKKINYYLLAIMLLLLGVASFFIYRRLRKQVVYEDSIVQKKESFFDHRSEALSKLRRAKRLFDNKRYKDAYGEAGQAIRLYLSYEHGLAKELTNDEVIAYLKDNNIPFDDIKECFDICSLVEFAKYKPDKKSFDKIILLAYKIIK